MDRGLVSRVEFERRRQNLLVSEQSLSRLQQDFDRLESERATAQSRMAQLDVSARRELSEIESAMAQLDLEKAQYEGERSYLIRSPISGRVSAIQGAQGRHVTGGTPLLVIVPEKAELRASLYAPSAAIGMVQPGQQTNLLLDAFPYQRFGSVEGRIAAISRTVLDPRDADVPFRVEEPVYQIEAELTQQSIEAFGEDVPFQPGMTLSANIVLEKQTFLDWLLTPLRAVLNRT
jgi:membrane fusion protein